MVTKPGNNNGGVNDPNFQEERLVNPQIERLVKEDVERGLREDPEARKELLEALNDPDSNLRDIRVGILNKVSSIDSNRLAELSGAEGDERHGLFNYQLDQHVGEIVVEMTEGFLSMPEADRQRENEAKITFEQLRDAFQSSNKDYEELTADLEAINQYIHNLEKASESEASTMSDREHDTATEAAFDPRLHKYTTLADKRKFSGLLSGGRMADRLRVAHKVKAYIEGEHVAAGEKTAADLEKAQIAAREYKAIHDRNQLANANKETFRQIPILLSALQRQAVREQYATHPRRLAMVEFVTEHDGTVVYYWPAGTHEGWSAIPDASKYGLTSIAPNGRRQIMSNEQPLFSAISEYYNQEVNNKLKDLQYDARRLKHANRTIDQGTGNVEWVWPAGTREGWIDTKLPEGITLDQFENEDVVIDDPNVIEKLEEIYEAAESLKEANALKPERLQHAERRYNPQKGRVEYWWPAGTHEGWIDIAGVDLNEFSNDATLITDNDVLVELSELRTAELEEANPEQYAKIGRRERIIRAEETGKWPTSQFNKVVRDIVMKTWDNQDLTPTKIQEMAAGIEANDGFIPDAEIATLLGIEYRDGDQAFNTRQVELYFGSLISKVNGSRGRIVQTGNSLSAPAQKQLMRRLPEYETIFDFVEIEIGLREGDYGNGEMYGHFFDGLSRAEIITEMRHAIESQGGVDESHDSATEESAKYKSIYLYILTGCNRWGVSALDFLYYLHYLERASIASTSYNVTIGAKGLQPAPGDPIDVGSGDNANRFADYVERYNLIVQVAEEMNPDEDPMYRDRHELNDMLFYICENYIKFSAFDFTPANEKEERMHRLYSVLKKNGYTTEIFLEYVYKVLLSRREVQKLPELMFKNFDLEGSDTEPLTNARNRYSRLVQELPRFRSSRLGVKLGASEASPEAVSTAEREYVQQYRKKVADALRELPPMSPDKLREKMVNALLVEAEREHQSRIDQILPGRFKKTMAFLRRHSGKIIIGGLMLSIGGGVLAASAAAGAFGAAGALTLGSALNAAGFGAIGWGVPSVVSTYWGLIAGGGLTLKGAAAGLGAVTTAAGASFAALGRYLAVSRFSEKIAYDWLGKSRNLEGKSADLADENKYSAEEIQEHIAANINQAMLRQPKRTELFQPRPADDSKRVQEFNTADFAKDSGIKNYDDWMLEMLRQETAMNPWDIADQLNYTPKPVPTDATLWERVKTYYENWAGQKKADTTHARKTVLDWERKPHLGINLEILHKRRAVDLKQQLGDIIAEAQALNLNSRQVNEYLLDKVFSLEEDNLGLFVQKLRTDQRMSVRRRYQDYTIAGLGAFAAFSGPILQANYAVAMGAYDSAKALATGDLPSLPNIDLPDWLGGGETPDPGTTDTPDNSGDADVDTGEGDPDKDTDDSDRDGGEDTDTGEGDPESDDDGGEGGDVDEADEGGEDDGEGTDDSDNNNDNNIPNQPAPAPEAASVLTNLEPLNYGQHRFVIPGDAECIRMFGDPDPAFQKMVNKLLVLNGETGLTTEQWIKLRNGSDFYNSFETINKDNILAPFTDSKGVVQSGMGALQQNTPYVLNEEMFRQIAQAKYGDPNQGLKIAHMFKEAGLLKENP